MEMIIGKILFLISSAWAITVYYKVTSSIATRRDQN